MKKQIDFYISTAKDFAANTELCLKLISKAFQHQHSIDVLIEDLPLTEKINQQLWTKQTHNFIPHDLDPTNPLSIQVNNTEQTTASMLINFSSIELGASQPYQRILQIVPNNPALLTQARAQYRQFKQQQYQVNSHNIG